MEALAVLHADKVYHRDIAPDNILLLADDRPVLLDFGAARRVISDMTHALTVILKPGYAPIEQYADMPGMKQGPWTDVYALAAVVYFMITKRKPPAAVSRMMQDSYEPLMQSDAAARYSPQLLQGIDRCLALRAEDRPQSMAAMREAIGLAMPPAAAPAPSPGQACRERARAGRAVRPRWLPRPAEPARRPSRSTQTPSRAPPAPPRHSRLPLVVGGVLASVVLVGRLCVLRQASGAGRAGSARPRRRGAGGQRPRSSAAGAASAVAAPAPTPAPRIASLAAAIDAALAAADPRLSITLEAPAGAAVGNDLTLSVRSKSDGLLYLFVWDQAADRIYRLTPEVKEGGNAIKADGSFTIKYRDAVKHAAKEPLGHWRVVSMLSERPRDFSTAAFVRDGDALVVERSALEARLAADGLASLFGTAQCAASEPCPDRFAISVADVAQEAPAPPPVAKRAPAAQDGSARTRRARRHPTPSANT